MLVNIIQNTISSFRSALAAAEVITTNLKMWLGFKTSETLGREEVVNGDFALDSDWAESTGWDVAGNGFATCDGSQTSNSNLAQVVYTPGKVYKTIITVDSVDAGSISIFTGTANSQLTITEADTYTIITEASTSDRIYIQANALFEGSISNVSVKELTQITPDKSGNNNVGELFTGKALDFDGANDYVNTTGFEMSGTSATFAFWIYPKDTAYQFVMDLDGTVRTILGLYNGGSGQVFAFFNFGFKQFGTPTQNQWQRVVFRVNATTVECYVDGVKSGSTLALASSIDLSTVGNSVIGGRFDTSNTGNRFDGSLSDFQIYNAYWSTDDIAYDYANPQNLVTDRSGTSIGLSNLKGYWHLSEGAGSTAYDSSGEGNNGAIIGATYEPAQPRIPQLGMQNWSKGSNLFPYSEDFTEWIISASTSQAVLAPTEAAPYGQGDVYSIIIQASESDAYIRYATTNATLTSSTHSVWVKQAPTGSASHIRITNNNRAAWNTGTSQKIALTSSWQRLETTDAITGNRFTIIGSADASGTQDSDCIGKALIYGAQLIEGSSAGVYRFTDGAETSNSIVIANPTIPTQDIFGNAVRDRLNSFNLDGSGYAEVADADDLDFGTGAFSFDGWAKYAFVNQGSSINTIYTHFVDSSTTGFSLNTETGGKISAWFGGVELELSAGLSEGDWFYFALTRDASGNVKLYASTDLENPATTTQNPILTITNAANKRVGGDATSIPNNGFSRHYHNLISDVRLYDAELSASEIENNYNAGLSAHTN